jgi:pyruvate/2-oxoglutarate dehydrogenase complex dihydrolipoamide dehydrogenase (E3) component
VATGATPRKPDIEGIDLPFVHSAAEVANGRSTLGNHVLVASEDDRVAPLAIADHLCGLGHRVTLVYRTNAPSPLVGKYTVGAILARLDTEGATLVPMARVDRIAPKTVTLAHSYSDRRWTINDVDSVVLATGATGNDSLYRSLKSVHPSVHVVGDAFAPRRVVFATRQAWHLAATID